MNRDALVGVPLTLVFLLAGCAGGGGDDFDTGGTGQEAETSSETTDPQSNTGSAPSGPQPASPGSSSEGEAPVAAPPPERELINEVYEYPRWGSVINGNVPPQGSQSTGTFDVAADAMTVEFRTKPTSECPAGYYRGPQILVTDPAGNEHTVRHLVDASPTVTYWYWCPNGSNPPQDPWIVKKVDAIPGTWSFTTTGECTCSGTFWVLTDPITPVPS